MKKLNLVLACLILSIGVYAQSTPAMKIATVSPSSTAMDVGVPTLSTPVSELRVANSLTTFGINIPVGTKIYNVGDGNYYVATAGVIGTASLSSTPESFELLNAKDLQMIDVSANTVTLSQSGGEVIIAGDGINTVATSGSTITVTGTEIDGDISNELQDLSYDPATRALSISLDGTGVALPEAVNNGNSGLLTGADKAKLDNLDDKATNTSFKVERFEEAITNTSGQTNSLSFIPKSNSAVLVSLNGVELKASQFLISEDRVKILIPVYQYDQVTISYTHNSTVAVER